jgi:hypothetical protein
MVVNASLAASSCSGEFGPATNLELKFLGFAVPLGLRGTSRASTLQFGAQLASHDLVTSRPGQGGDQTNFPSAKQGVKVCLEAFVKRFQ